MRYLFLLFLLVFCFGCKEPGIEQIVPGQWRINTIHFEDGVIGTPLTESEIEQNVFTMKSDNTFMFYYIPGTLVYGTWKVKDSILVLTHELVSFNVKITRISTDTIHYNLAGFVKGSMVRIR